MSSNTLIALKEAGQSPWLDNLSRDLIESGKLKRMVDEQGLCGVTSNPSIFQQALAGSKAYDRALEDLLNKGLRDTRQLFFALALEDIAAAADILLPVYNNSGGNDGFLSLEVSPDLAYDTDATIEEALRLFQSLARKNVMIKVPATLPGLSAIESLIAAGVNINVTLLFSVPRYQQVMEAYLKGLEQRLEQGKSIKDIASVASFFVSRVDVMIDALLKQKIGVAAGEEKENQLAELFGQAAVANARLANQAFEQIFQGRRFKELEKHGARIQRLLWGSTSTKNPDYSDIKYVQELIGPNTVNTMPEETMLAFADHGEVKETICQDVDKADKLFTDLKRLDIDINVMTDRLEKEGVDKFSKSFTDLLGGIADKRDRLLQTRAE